ncbi:MAG: phosphomannomutase/phosphoglucomutase [Methylohalobius crimeensis]
MSLARWLVILLTAALVSLTLAVTGTYFLAWQKSRANEARAWSDYARSVARQIQIRQKYLLAWVDGLARDPRVADVLTGEGKPISDEEQRLLRMIPHAVEVRIIPREAGAWTDSGNLGLGFADMDLVNQAETGAPPPAVHDFTSSERHVAVARAVRRADQVIGVLLVGIDVQWLEQALPAPPQGAVALRQGALWVAFRGEDALKEASPAASLPISGTPWQLQYWIPSSDWITLLGGVAIWAVTVLVLGILFGWVWRKGERAIEADRTTLFTLANDLAAGTVRGNYSMALQELRPLLDRLLQLQRSRWSLEQAALSEEELVAGETAPLPETESQPEVRVEETPPSLPEKAQAAPVTLPEVVFRPSAIAGVVGETLTPESVRELGRAIGSESESRGEQMVAVGRDARASSEALVQALNEGLRASGRDVIDLGKVPTAVVNFATHYLPNCSGVMVTAGSDPPEYNGLKIVVGGEPCGEKALLALNRRLQKGDLSSGMGMLESRDLLADYIGAIIDDVQIGRPLKVVVDYGPGVAGQVAPALLRTLGCEVEELHTQGALNPFAPGALDRLIGKVREDREVELGLAFDGDGNRLAVVDAQGEPILPDRVLMLLAADVLSREPGGDIVFDVQCSRHLAGYIVQHGGRPVVTPSGDNPIRAKMAELGAVLGGGFDGSLLFQERWTGLPDAIYGAARLVELLSAEPLTSDEIFAELPQGVVTPRLHVDLPPGEPETMMQVLVASSDKFFRDAKINTIDGIRADYADGWGLVSVSKSVPGLVFRFEADNEEALFRIQGYFREWFETLEIDLDLPFGVRVE